MSQKTIYITIGILATLGIIIFAAGFFLVRQGKIPALEPEIAKNLFPFGESGETRNIAERSQPDSAVKEVASQEAIQSFGALRQISTRPVAGATFFIQNGKANIRYMEKQTGHIYEIEAGGTRANRISNMTIPGIQNVLWGEGESIILQYLDGNDRIKSVSANIVRATSTSETLRGTFLPDDIRDIAISEDGKKIFYILSLGNAAIGTIANIDGGSRKQIFESAIAGWIPVWIDQNTISLATKPSAFTRGYVYTLSSESGNIQKILGDISGLTALVSKNKNSVLFSASAQNSFETFLYKVQGETMSPFPISTLPEKCLWSKDNITLYCGAPEARGSGAYPDLWYQGRVSFSDTVWKINTETGALSVLAIPKDDAREEIDFVNPVLDENETMLIFTNKKDSSLWSLQLR